MVFKNLLRVRQLAETYKSSISRHHHTHLQNFFFFFFFLKKIPTLTSKHRNILPGINLSQQLSSDGHHRPWGTQGCYDLDWGCVICIISLQEFNMSNSLLNIICDFSFKTWSLNRIKTNCTPYSQFNHVLTRDVQSLTQCHTDRAEWPL